MSNAESPKPKTESVESSTESSTVESSTKPIDVSPELSGSLVTSAKEDKSTEGWSTEGGSTDQLQQYWYKFLSVLSNLPDYWSQISGEYNKPITIVLLIVAGLISIKVTLAAIDALNDIPLLAPLFELIGIGYSAWFIWRYLWRDSTRRELMGEIRGLTEQVVGKNQPK